MNVTTTVPLTTSVRVMMSAHATMSVTVQKNVARKTTVPVTLFVTLSVDVHVRTSVQQKTHVPVRESAAVMITVSQILVPVTWCVTAIRFIVKSG